VNGGFASVARGRVLRSCAVLVVVAVATAWACLGGANASGSTCPPLPARVSGPPPAALLSILGVLRQPPSAAHAVPTQALQGESDLYVNYVRFARSAFGRDWYVWVSAPRFHPPGACSSPGVTLFGVGVGGGGGGGDASAAQIESHGSWMSISGGTGADPARTLFAGVVPDGVATVTLQYPAGKLGGFSRRSGPALTVTGHAVSNVVVVSVERAGEQATGAVTTTWRTTSGTIIKTLHGAL
jgi:hypothetical protein